MNSDLLIKKDEDTIQCQVCNHFCLIKENKSGICGIRKNINGKINLQTYNYPVSIAIDPIEKKPLYHFLPNTKILSYATTGCNFSCGFCQNHSISQLKSVEAPYGEITPERMIEIAKEYKTPSIAATYTEPTVFFEYAFDIMKLAKKSGIKNVWVSNGYFSEKVLNLIIPYLDAINVDLKSFNEETYKKLGGNLQPVLENIKTLHKNNIHIEITTLLVTDLNDSEEEINQISKFIANIDKNIPFHISKFFPRYKFNNICSTRNNILYKAKEIALNNGLNFVYLGNI